jgi:glycosyltransferase involved in cell wall biosynthesis
MNPPRKEPTLSKRSSIQSQRKAHNSRLMKILMLAPEPFFQPRGTPISVYFRNQALSDLGHKIDLVTYHLGENVNLKNLKILRIPNLSLIRKVRIGPSLAKIPLDFLLLVKAFSQLVKRKYDLIFSHEEASFLGTILAKLWGLPHLYDMHSSLPQQLENFEFTRSRVFISAFAWLEKFVLKNSQAIIVICPDLQQKVNTAGHGKKSVCIENFIDFKGEEFTEVDIKKKRSKYAPAGEKIVVYTGNFEPYQGISLLIEAASRVREDVIFLLIGGTEEEIETMKHRAKEFSVSEKVMFIKRVSPFKIPIYISLADVLVSPRISGTNTPLKIYSFMKSGKPIVATNIWTHTQVLNENNSVLVKPEPENMAAGITYAAFDEEAKKRAKKCQEHSEHEYSYPRYLEKISQALRIAGQSSLKG